MRRIELGIRASLAWFAEHREYFAIIQFAATDETFAPVLARNREISIADTIRHLKDGIVDGRIADRDPALLAHAIHGVVAELTRHDAHRRATCPSTRSPTSASPSASKASAADAAGPRSARAQPSLVRPLRIWRMACWMRFSFSTSAKRTKPSPPGPKPLPGESATFASWMHIVVNSMLVISA